MQQQIEKLLSDRCMLDRGGMGPRADPAAATGQEGTRGSSCQAIIAKPRAAGGEQLEGLCVDVLRSSA
jgi:hypothetical protein